MMKLQATKRDSAKNTEKMRSGGMIPSVMYGKKTESTPLSVAHSDFLKLWHAAGETTVFTLSDGTEEHDALIHDVQVHPVTGEPQHVDFYIVEKGQKVQVGIPLVLVGSSPAIDDLGGTLVRVLHELEVEAEPRNLPHELEVDISALVDFESTIHVRDIKLPSGVVALADPEDVVVAVTEAKELEEPEPTEAVDFSDIEVEGEKKEGGEEPSGEQKEE